MMAYVLGLSEIDPTRIHEVGGKGSSLGALARIDGVRVPEAFCVTTDALRRVLAALPQLDALIDQLSMLKAEDREAIQIQSAMIRGIIKRAPIPDELAEQVRRALIDLGEHEPTAVRSSATAEDLPTASFAGQQDSALNVIGAPAVLHQIRRCWASLFTERAVAYRIRQGFEHRAVSMAVVVQRLIVPDAAGVLFTADPFTGDRKVCSIEASFGLGEALVSGLVTPDHYKARRGQIISRTIGTKTHAIRALEGGGTITVEVAPEQQRQPVLSDAAILQLEALGRRIEACFGAPQDIEWCLADGELYLVQSRPITTLYPVPDAGDAGTHVFVSVGHGQMMTDAMRPLGLSLFQLTAGRPMFEAGGRLFVDPTQQLASPASRAVLLEVMGRSDPLIRDALTTLLDRGDLFETSPAAPSAPAPRAAAHGAPAPVPDDPSVVTGLIQRSEARIAALKQSIQTKFGLELLDFILEDTQELKQSLMEPSSFGALMAGMNAASWLGDHLLLWLGEKGAIDTLSQSAPNNITSEMGLALLDVADVIRPHPAVIAYLQTAEEAGFWEGFAPLQGGPAARDAIAAWLKRFGMRCAGEIDVTRTRWSERPTTLVPLILSHVRTFEPCAAGRRFEQGEQAAATQEQAILTRLRQLPDGEQKAAETESMIRRLRTFIGYREYPKYGIVSRYFVYKQALLAEAERLLQAGVIQERDDITFLSLPELREVVRSQQLDPRLIRQRREQHALNQRLTPPRVITSDGEIVTGAYRRAGVPAGALVGLAVSSGVVEGRARVLLDMAEAALEPGDILVTPFTDPSWTPLFVAIAGLVTEVGGLMTHGAVIAREYGLPAVIGVERATERIKDGDRIRVHGTEGYVEILS